MLQNIAKRAFSSRFQDRVAIVTGGSHGIGKCITQKLLDEGCKVAITCPPKDQGAWQHENMIEFAGDMADKEFCDTVYYETVKELGEVNHLVNNSYSFLTKEAEPTIADWDRVMHDGPIQFAQMIKLCAISMKKPEVQGKSIVCITCKPAPISIQDRWSQVSIRRPVKGAVNQFVRNYAMDYGSYGIRINGSNPGWTFTREEVNAAGNDRAKQEPIWGNYSMLKRLCEREEQAPPVLFLLSDEASFITGTELMVDGGYMALGREGRGEKLEILRHFSKEINGEINMKQ